MTPRITPLAFAWKYHGLAVQAAGGIGGECVDLANQWIWEAYGDAHEYLNAVDWAGIAVPHHIWTPNGPTNYPPTGALVVWGANAAVGTGQFGHIALCLSADAMHLATFDQNWAQRVCLLELHPYNGVKGWHVPG